MPGSSQRLDEWLARLETYAPQEIDLGLERVQAVLERLDLERPETIFHIAGTNGKGSTVALLESVLQTTGRRVACYTSPHLQRYNERMRVAGEDVSDAEIIAAFELVEAQRDNAALTYFEFGTLAALVIFAIRKVDIAILEIGMGGRLDAVNAVEPTASLITNIALDHCDWLGDNVEAIAREKAGVMRTGKPVIFAAPEMPKTIEAIAAEKQAQLIAATRDYQWYVADADWEWRGENTTLSGLMKPGLAGAIQIQNAAGVLALIEASGFDTLLDEQGISAALAATSLPGRAQVIDGRYIVDVAHNPAAATALAQALGGIDAEGTRVTIVGMLDDKDVEGVATQLNSRTDHWLAVRAESPRGIAAAELSRRVANATNRPCWIADSMQQALSRADALAGKDGQVLITGSFYTVATALVILAAPRHEYG